MRSTGPAAQSADGSHASGFHRFFKAQAERIPNAIAIVAPGRTALAYGRLYAQVQHVVTALNSYGVGRHDRVAVVLPSGPELAVALVGVAAGAVCIPLNPDYRAGEFDSHLSDLGAKALIVPAGSDSPAIAVAHAHSIPLIELASEGSEAGTFSLSGESLGPAAHAGFAHADDIALIFYTSGTTSRPKMVPLTHASLLASAGTIAATLQLIDADRCLNVMPLFHVHGLVGAFLSSMIAGSSVVLTSGFTPDTFFAWLEEFRPTWYTAVPTMHHAVLSSAAPHRERIRRCPLRFIRSSSAPLPLRVMQELEETFQAPVIEAYGMTETAHQVASNPLPPGTRKARSVGRPTGTEAAVLDDQDNPLPCGRIGQIAIRGGTVMSGYANDPEATRARFSHDGWFKTGDQGYVDPDGYVFLTGRLTETINRGGEKIAPIEIDEVLKQHPAVAEAVAFAVPHSTLGEDVAAAVVLRPGQSITEAEAQRFAAARLTEFKVPRRVLIVDGIPKVATGKIQRIGLAEQLGLAEGHQGEPGSEAAAARPRTPTEAALAGIWSHVLGVAVGVHDAFFQLGGDSIRAAQIISRLHASLGVELPFSAFLDTPTVAAMARTIDTAGRDQPGGRPMLRPGADTGLLSHGQEALWFLDQLTPGNPAYHRPLFVRLHGPLDRQALERAINEIVRRHAVLRARFPAFDGQPVQRITAPEPLALPVTDLSRLLADDRVAQALTMSTEEARRPFDLARGPLVRTNLLRLDERSHALLIVTHHIVFDGWSAEILLRELATLYHAFVAERPSPLPEPPIQYPDFARWQRAYAEQEAVRGQLAYWRRQLSGSPPALTLPTDRPPPPAPTFNGAGRRLLLGEVVSQGLREVSRQEHVSLFMTLLAAFKALLYRYSGQEEIVVGTPFAGRNQIDAEDSIGLFINTLPLRTDLSGDPTFRELLARVRRTCLDAHAHQDISFERIVADLQPKRGRGGAVLFNVLFQLRNYPRHSTRSGALDFEEYDAEIGTAQFDLSVAVREEHHGLECRFEYDTDLFEDATISRMMGHFQILLEGVVKNPSQRLSDVPILTEVERRQLLVEWTDTAADYPKSRCIHELFEAQVERTPEAVALIFEGRQLTYRDLNAQANRLAHYLTAVGVGPGVLVGVCVDRCPDMVVGLLAILKAGGAYVPLDPGYPRERLAFMVRDAQAPVVLTQRTFLDALPVGLDLDRSVPKTRDETPDIRRPMVVCLDSDRESLAQQSAENPDGRVTPDDLAYVIYTSGSTGAPKGILGLHRGSVNRLQWMWTTFPYAEQETACQKTSLSFVDSVCEIFGPLLRGVPTVLLNDTLVKDPYQLSRALASHQVTRIVLVPSMLSVLLDAVDDIATRLPHLRLWVSSGEALSPELRQSFRERLPHARLLNLYGSSEVSADSTWHDTSQAASPSRVPIGRPIANTQIYVLDPYRRPVPIGVPGELYIGGDGVARGYLNRPDLTAEKFILNPFSSGPADRLYRTGDRARYLPDGNLEFLGRLDHQVKIRGIRIELGEIEAAVRQHPAVQEAVVLARDEGEGTESGHEIAESEGEIRESPHKRLVAYIVTARPGAPPPSDLRETLKRQLPDHMMPSAFVFLDALPQTPNGKVDRRALPAPDRARGELENVFVASRDVLELQLAKIWAEILNVGSVGIRDNFFDRGGHSLLAARLFAQVEKVFGRSLPLVTLFQAPTVELLADILRQKDWAAPWSSLVALQPLGSKRPFFCVHTVGGGLFRYHALARHLAPDQPVYGLQAPGLDGKSLPPHRLEDLAARYIVAIRKLLPEGPYSLGGLSLGGKIAFEMARQLKAQGQEIALLALVDTHGPGYPTISPHSTRAHRQVYYAVRRLTQRIDFHLQNLRLLEPQERRLYVAERGWNARKRITARIAGRIKREEPEGSDHPLSPAQLNVEAVLLRASRNYIPGFYPGRVTLFRASKRPPEWCDDPRLGWGELAGEGLDIYEVPGWHTFAVQEPCVRVLAKQLRMCLDAAQRPTR